MTFVSFGLRRPACHIVGMAIVNFYMDKSGDRNPQHQPPEGWGANCHWFALGGVLIDGEAEEEARGSILAFHERWPQLRGAPLHSYEIRNKRDGCHWLRDLGTTEFQRFMDDFGTYCPRYLWLDWPASL